MTEIRKNLYQFTTTLDFMNFTIHQYLLDNQSPVMVSTGTKQQAELILPQIKKILGKKPLEYLLISHLESDECGGIEIFLKAYPTVQILCSQMTARELSGFGIHGNIKAKTQKDILIDEDIHIHFIDYPSEAHLQNGFVFFEENSKIFFSADLMLRFGLAEGQTLNSEWKKEVDGISEERIPVEKARKKLQEKLYAFQPHFIAVGHGYCVNL